MSLILPEYVQKQADNKKSLEEMGNWYSHYMDWKEDDSRIKLFEESKQTIVPEIVLMGGEEKEIWKMLVEAYIYYPKPTPNDLKHTDPDSELTATQEKHLKSLPFVKVLWHRNSENIGKIFTVQDSYARIGTNPEYREYLEAIAEKPSLKGKIPPPPTWSSGWGALGKYSYQIQKFKDKPSLIDLHTFLIPEQGFIVTKSEI